MDTQVITDLEPIHKENLKPKWPNSQQDSQMTSSTVSSLASPVDSGVQLLDSESEVTSVMSASGLGCDIDAIPSLDSDLVTRNTETELSCLPDFVSQEKSQNEKEGGLLKSDQVMTKSDIDNQNVIDGFKNLSASVPNYFDKLIKSPLESFDKRTSLRLDKSFSDDVFEMEHPIRPEVKQIQSEQDVMNVSLNSYELLDYTLQNRNLNAEVDQMHVSMSEEVNETLKISTLSVLEDSVPIPIPENPVVENEPKANEEQIVFRRQRKKKSKSDTPKKRVSFHEDILNSTKIDDIHINHGFITHESDVSLSFFQKGFIRKPDVVKGRYSWAAEGDAPYYEKPGTDREIKSDIYVQNNPRYSSTSSSSTGSSSSSIDEEKDPVAQKLPKSSCLKKTNSGKKYMDTNIVQEETKRKSETNLLDSNIFGSLKNILNFSTSLPLTERGVPEGQEDLVVYSSSHDLAAPKRSNFAGLAVKQSIEAVSAPVDKLSAAKASLKLTKIEGFYPNYPNNQNLPSNIILCDSNVYEHKGISYSYEYEKFQKNFDKVKQPKGSTVYQRILREFNFFRRKAKDDNVEAEEDFEIVQPKEQEMPVVEVEEPEVVGKFPCAKLDWSDNETVISDLSENQNSRHLNSPKRKINKSNHYQIQSTPFKAVCDQSRLDMGQLRSSTSKTSLINRFLRNVTMKKILDVKAQNKQRTCRKYMGLYVKGAALKGSFSRNLELDRELDLEVSMGKEKLRNDFDEIDKKQLIQFRKEIFRSCLEVLLKVFPVRSAYTTNGYSKPLLLILSNTTLYVAGFNASNSYCNHFVLPYTELNTILIGPNAQTIHFSNYDNDMQCIVHTGCAILTSELIGKLELAMRRDFNKPNLPAVKQLTMRDMVNLRRAICRQTSVEMDEEYYYYSIVSIQDFIQGSSDIATPMGPTKEGPLMFRTSNQETRWETAYFILKAGVLYMLSSASQRVPMRVFPLINGSCQGARRIFNTHRPHTFQLIIDGKSLQLAAPDEYVASEWLQELIHAASGTYNHREKTITQSCSLLMTSDHILTVREAFPCMIPSLLPAQRLHDPIKGAQALSCAAIVDLTSFRLPSAEQSWCVLEFACREVHECSGDWILYFASNSELEAFISTLEMLWAYNNENGDSFPLSTIPETDPLSKRCVDVYTSLIGTWSSNVVHLQFL